jgi:uncharacterized membrane protein YgcG
MTSTQSWRTLTDQPARWLPVALLTAALFLSGCASAGGRLLLVEQTVALDRADIEAAAAPLVARGAIVAVVVVERGDEQGADFARRLEAAQLLRGDAIVAEGIAVYVSLNPHYSELRAGSRWSGALPSDALRTIRQDVLNPALRAGSFTGGVAATLAALDARIAGGWSILAWLGAAVRWLAYGVTAAVLLFFAAALTRPALEWLKDAWLASPPGRLAAWLWEQTPPGRRRATLRRTARAADMLRFTESRSGAARSYLSEIAATSAQRKQLRARLDALDKRRRELAGRTIYDAALVRDLEQLYKDYGPLLDECHKLMPVKKAQSRAGSHAFPTPSSWSSSSESQAGSSSNSSDWSSSSFDSGSSGGESRDGGSW